MNTIHPVLKTVTDRITERSSAPRAATCTRLAKRATVDRRAASRLRQPGRTVPRLPGRDAGPDIRLALPVQSIDGAGAVVKATGAEAFDESFLTGVEEVVVEDVVVVVVVDDVVVVVVVVGVVEVVGDVEVVSGAVVPVLVPLTAVPAVHK